MIVNERSPRCTCGHSAGSHQRLGPGTHCSECNRIRCPHYVSLGERDHRYLTWPQRHALAESDANMYRNLAALAPFARTGERLAATRIPTQRSDTVAVTPLHRVLDTRRNRTRRPR